MRSLRLPALPLLGLLMVCIPQQAYGEMPQGHGRRPMPGMRPESAPVLDARPAMGSPAMGSGERPGRPSLPAAPPGRPPVSRPTYSRLGGTASFAYLPAFSRCTVLPTALYWRDRDYDIMAAIQREARRGFIPVTAFPVDQDTVMGTSMVASGWRAYGFVVPPGGEVQLKLSHPKPGWFRVYWVDQWGEYRPGMMVKPGEPEALYLNQGKKPMAVYAIVDDPGQWATNAASAFTLTAKRTFDAAHMDTGGVTVHQGIWNTAPESYWMSAAHP